MQRDSRACRFSQRLAVLLANDLEGDVFQLSLPAKSIFGAGEPGKWPLQTYAKMIGSKGVPITAVVTEMRFDTDESTPKLTFKPARVLTADEHTLVVKQGASDDAQRAITMTVAQAAGVKDVADNGFFTPDPQPEAPAPVAEPTKEPTKRAKKEEPAPKKDLTTILDEWDD